MKRVIIVILLSFIVTLSFAQHKKAYTLFNAKGKKVSYKKMVKAQAMKDATMAHFILANYETGKLFIHYNGAYHSNDHEGILWYIQQANKQLKMVTISTTSQKDFKKLLDENKLKADFIICVDEDMTTTY